MIAPVVTYYLRLGVPTRLCFTVSYLLDFSASSSSFHASSLHSHQKRFESTKRIENVEGHRDFEGSLRGERSGFDGNPGAKVRGEEEERGEGEGGEGDEYEEEIEVCASPCPKC